MSQCGGVYPTFLVGYNHYDTHCDTNRIGAPNHRATVTLGTPVGPLGVCGGGGETPLTV